MALASPLCMQTITREALKHKLERGDDFALVEVLSPALRRVAQCLLLGMSDKEIAERLELPLVTARTYVSRALRRLGVKNRRELLARG